MELRPCHVWLLEMINRWRAKVRSNDLLGDHIYMATLNFPSTLKLRLTAFFASTVANITLVYTSKYPFSYILKLHKEIRIVILIHCNMASKCVAYLLHGLTIRRRTTTRIPWF